MIKCIAMQYNYVNLSLSKHKTTTEGAKMKTNIATLIPDNRSYAIAKNATTGVIHKITSGGSSWCGSSKRNRHMRKSSVHLAPATMFCEKCFNSKPEIVYEMEIEVRF
jgi:hypothetical protein